MRLASILEYDGTRFHGSQLQAGVRTVQGELESALEGLFGTPTRAALASRTDAGVHALGQVAAYNANANLTPDTVTAALNSRLPKDAKIRRTVQVDAGFDPRRHAKARTYIYRLHISPTPPAVMRHAVAHIRPPLELEPMQRAAAALAGQHDFAAFAGPATPQGASTRRNVRQCTLEQNGQQLAITITANAFLHQQVRRIAAALVALGKHRLQQDEFNNLISNGQRGGWTAMLPPAGLCLQTVEYSPPLQGA